MDASRFSGTEQSFAGAPYISLQKSNVVFFDAESIDADASIDRGARNRSRIAIFGARTIFLRFPLILLLFETDKNLQHEEIDASRFSGT